MSYSVLIVAAVIVVVAMIFTAMCFRAFRLGVKYGIDKENAVKEPFIPMPKKKPKETKEMKQMRKLEKAIAEYNGDE